MAGDYGGHGLVASVEAKVARGFDDVTATDSKPHKSNQIGSNLEILSDKIGRLDDAINNYLNRTMVVMGPDEETNKRADSEPTREMSPLAGRLRIESERLEMLINAVHDATARLEI